MSLAHANGIGPATIAERVRAEISGELGIPVQRINAASHIANDLDADDSESHAILPRLEDAFDIDIPVLDWMKAATVADVIALVEGRVR